MCQPYRIAVDGGVNANVLAYKRSMDGGVVAYTRKIGRKRWLVSSRASSGREGGPTYPKVLLR